MKAQNKTVKLLLKLIIKAYVVAYLILYLFMGVYMFTKLYGGDQKILGFIVFICWLMTPSFLYSFIVDETKQWVKDNPEEEK